MKRCPQCRAEYDDYVQYCFVDGTELRVVPSSEPSNGPSGTGAPLGERTAAGGIEPRPAPLEDPSHDAPPWSRPSNGTLVLGFAAIGGLGIVVLAMLVFVLSPTGSPSSGP